jgi:hypothetical protein
MSSARAPRTIDEFLAKGGVIKKLSRGESALAGQSGEAVRVSWGQFGSYVGYQPRTRTAAWFDRKKK